MCRVKTQSKISREAFNKDIWDGGLSYQIFQLTNIKTEEKNLSAVESMKMGIRHSLVFSDPKSRQFVPRTRNLTKKNTSAIIFSLLFSFLLSHFMWVLFQLYVHNIWYRFANNVIWHWITSMITVLFQIVSCWIVEIVNSQSSSSS